MIDLSVRFSPSAFDKSTVEEAEIEAIVRAASWAPSAYNEQPWSFHVALRQDQAAFEEFLKVLSESNQTWAKDSSALVFSVARRERRKDGQKNDYAFYDTGQAVAHLSIAALSVGLQLHQMQGFVPAQCRRLLKLETGVDPVTAIAIGRPAHDQHFGMAHRTRKSIEEFFAMHREAQP
ncbi:nitroreductase family protein [Yoonia sp. GPGPB17]|uniref:nitroreductase family protein n=1 Tax=Yoonia sp. GPGPB17 TaxID=3026147 RepID=UPI0030C6515C